MGYVEDIDLFIHLHIFILVIINKKNLYECHKLGSNIWHQLNKDYHAFWILFLKLRWFPRLWEKHFLSYKQKTRKKLGI